MEISKRQIRAAYQIATDVSHGKETVGSGAEKLNKQYGLNINSARDLINGFKAMTKGKVFHRSISAPAADYFYPRLPKAMERTL